MRSRTLIEMHDDLPTAPRKDTYERVRRTLDEALAELQLPLERLRRVEADADRSAPHRF